MTAIPYESPEEDWDSYEEDESVVLPGRPRRQFWGRRSAALIAVLVGAACFYAGVRVEKGQLSSATSTSALSAAAARVRAAAGSGGFAGGGLAGRALAGGGDLGDGGSSFGTVTSVNGKTILVTETSGNVVKVTLSGATKVTKNVGVSKKAIRPGDAVVVQGLSKSGGTIVAASVSDTGAGAGRSGVSRSGAGSGSSGGAASAVKSLFGSGGGG